MPCSADTVAGGVVPLAVMAVPPLAAAGACPLASALSTSRLTMPPCGPRPESAAISTPAFLASLRANGEAKTRSCALAEAADVAVPALAELCAAAGAGRGAADADDADALAAAVARGASAFVAACGVGAFGLLG